MLSQTIIKIVLNSWSLYNQLVPNFHKYATFHAAESILILRLIPLVVVVVVVVATAAPGTRYMMLFMNRKEASRLLLRRDGKWRCTHWKLPTSREGNSTGTGYNRLYGLLHGKRDYLATMQFLSSEKLLLISLSVCFAFHVKYIFLFLQVNMANVKPHCTLSVLQQYWKRIWN